MKRLCQQAYENIPINWQVEIGIEGTKMPHAPSYAACVALDMNAPPSFDKLFRSTTHSGHFMPSDPKASVKTIWRMLACNEDDHRFALERVEQVNVSACRLMDTNVTM